MLDGYLWLKAGHIVSVIAWMAGLFYLPRLYVHHVEQASNNEEMKATFIMMERKLLRVIMNPAMIASWGFGLSLVLMLGLAEVLSSGWFHVKLVALLGMTWFHMWLASRRKALEQGTDTTSGRRYRLMNEVPTVLMLVIVIMVVVKPI